MLHIRHVFILLEQKPNFISSGEHTLESMDQFLMFLGNSYWRTLFFSQAEFIEINLISFTILTVPSLRTLNCSLYLMYVILHIFFKFRVFDIISDGTCHLFGK
jgi:hypothetical protein